MKKTALILVIFILLNLCSCGKKKDDSFSDSYRDEVFGLDADSGEEHTDSEHNTASGKGGENTPSSESGASDGKFELSTYGPVDTEKKNSCKHPKTDGAPTCEKPALCLVCGDVAKQALGHHFVNGVCDRSGCGATPQKWVSADSESITLSELNQILSLPFQKPKNVILMIGDGMGPNDIILTEKLSSSRYSFGLILNQIVNTGFSTTYSNSSEVTDSAAAGTALATGVKTDNGRLGISSDGKTLKNVSEYAREKGKKVGLVTNDKATGATPAAFAVHMTSRNATSLIAQDIVSFAPDVFIGQNYDAFSKLNLKKFVVANGIFDFESTLNKYNISCARPFWGFTSYNTTYNKSYLNYCTDVALHYLKKCSPNGFFLMVENTTCDNAGHNKNIEGKINGVVSLDRAIVPVLKFMKENTDTVLVIVSDHECGGVTVPSGNYTLQSSFFTTSSHTGVPVRTFAVGYGTERFKGKTVDNTDIGKFLINAVCGKIS